MKKIPNIFLLTLIALVILLHENTFPQKSIDKKIEYRSEELEKIRKEIRQFKNNLKKTESKEKTLFTKLQETEKEISLTQKLTSKLQHEQRKKEKEIEKTNKSIKNLESELKELKNRFAKRMVHVYKQGDFNDWELILTSQSLNQAIYRYKYLRIISEIDKKTSSEIRSHLTEIDHKKQRLISEVEDKEKIIAERKKYQKTLSKQKIQRERQLKKARRDVKNLQAQLKEKERAVKRLSNLIADLEKERERRKEELARQRALLGVKADNPFLKNQGKLIWPTTGKVISKFGIQKHPTLNTITENSGIDIKAKKGAPVRAILDGMITTITYIRGFGNTIIIDHGSGFYSVYTHVENVVIFENQYISTNTVIASVGDSGSLEGSLLHFEIWKNRIKLNPENWLAKR